MRIRVEVHGAGDGDRLSLAAGQRLHRRLQVLEARVEALHHLLRGRVHRLIVERPGLGAQLAEEHVGCSIDVVGQRELLVDDLYAVVAGVAGCG